MNRTSVFQQKLDHKSEVNSDVLYQAFYSFYYLAKDNKFFIDFLQHTGLRDLENFDHMSTKSCREIFLPLDRRENQIVNKLSRVTYFGLIVDDMSDIC